MGATGIWTIGVAAAVLAGCTTSVVRDDGDDASSVNGGAGAGSGSAEGAGGAGGAGGADEDRSVAMVEVVDGWATFGFANFPLRCGEALGFEASMPSCNARYEYLFEVEMPVERVVPGVVDLADDDVWTYSEEQQEADGFCSSSCCLGPEVGVLEIDSVSADEVTGRVSLALSFVGVEIVEFTASRCGDAFSGG
jgi:hypothetical protein